MQINNHYEPEIRLKDIFFEILYHWRSIVVASVIGALLLGGFQYYSVWSTHREGGKTHDEQQYELALKQYELELKANEEKLRVTRTLSQQLEDYMEKSVLYNMDATAMVREERSYLVTAAQSGEETQGISFQDPVDYVMASYASSLFNGLDPEQMQAMLGTSEKKYMNELVRLAYTIDTNMMTLTAYGADEQKAREICDFFANRITTVCAGPIQALYPHELLQVSDIINVGPTDSVQQNWDKNATDLMTYQEAISEAEEAVLSLKNQGKPTAPGMHLGRMAALGFVLFAFLTVVYWAVRYLAGGRLRNGREMLQRYGLFVYGEADHSRARRPGKGFDGVIERWEFGKARTEAAEACRQAAALLAPNLSGNALVLVSTRPSESVQLLKQALESEAGAKQVVVAGEFHRSEGSTRLPDGADLLIVEEKYVSRTEKIRREAEILAMQGANVRGAVVL